MFYDNSILSGTKIKDRLLDRAIGFTITQFFQVLKSVPIQTVAVGRFTITQFFQVLKFTDS